MQYYISFSVRVIRNTCNFGDTWLRWNIDFQFSYYISKGNHFQMALITRWSKFCKILFRVRRFLISFRISWYADSAVIRKNSQNSSFVQKSVRGVEKVKVVDGIKVRWRNEDEEQITVQQDMQVLQERNAKIWERRFISDDRGN